MPIPLRFFLTGQRVAILQALALAACSSARQVLPPSGDRLAPGTWGGDSAAAIVSDSGTHVHIRCTFGDVAGIVPLSGGHFDVAGSYMLRAYPVAVGPSVPARFVGQVDGATLRFTVTVNDTVQHQTVVLGPVSVTYGQAAHMGPCPICRKPNWGGTTDSPRSTSVAARWPNRRS